LAQGLDQGLDQPGSGEDAIACFVDNGGGRAKRRKRLHHLQQPEIQALAGRNAPAPVLAPLHARHLDWTLGRNGAGKNSSLGMAVRERRHDWQDPVHPLASAKDLRPKKSAACRRTGGRCARFSVHENLDVILFSPARVRGPNMRGADERSGSLLSYVDLEARVGRNHPLRMIRTIVNEALARLTGDFSALYSRMGRPSIPPEKLLRAMLLQAF
jgi:hypothetical protein